MPPFFALHALVSSNDDARGCDHGAIRRLAVGNSYIQCSYSAISPAMS
jgi:hypothetical protein